MIMTTAHTATSIVAVEVTSSTSTITATASATTTTAWWEWNPTVALVLGLSLFDVDSASIDFCHGVVLYEVLCYRLIGESDEAKST